MSKEKQIEEIKRDIFAAFGGYEKWEEDWQSLAEAVYNAGYRKQIEGEWVKDKESKFEHRYHCSVCGFYQTNGLYNHAKLYDRVVRFVVDAPTEDVVEVVRCKDCKHFISEVCRHDFALNFSRGDDFCCYGERKE